MKYWSWSFPGFPGGSICWRLEAVEAIGEAFWICMPGLMTRENLSHGGEYLMWQQTARFLILAGFALVLIGGLVLLAVRFGVFNWIGKIPGDFRFTSKDGRFTLFLPLTTSLILSILLTVVANLILKLLNK